MELRYLRTSKAGQVLEAQDRIEQNVGRVAAERQYAGYQLLQIVGNQI